MAAHNSTNKPAPVHHTATDTAPPPAPPSDFGLLIIGDEILSGRRADRHIPQTIDILGQRGLALSWVHVVGDDPPRITAALRTALASGQPVFSCGGIGATPDDHTRQCAAAAAEVPLEPHPQARSIILERMAQQAREQHQPFDPQSPDMLRRLEMGTLPRGARLVPNPYNQIPGFALEQVYFLPGFPVMAWPMMEWVLDTDYRTWHGKACKGEYSVIVPGVMESVLTPLMQRIEAQYTGVKVFSLPSVDHPQYGMHIELGTKCPHNPPLAQAAFHTMLEQLRQDGHPTGPTAQR